MNENIDNPEAISFPPDSLNAIGVLTRREIEVRILAPLLQAYGQAFGKEPVLEIASRVIRQVARQQGAVLAQEMGGCSLAHFVASLENWKKNDAMQLRLLLQDEQHFSFDVLRCRYAEMYHELGIPELGVILSCSRDHALVEGFNPHIHLTRSQTIMEGAPHCDFRFELRQPTLA